MRLFMQLAALLLSLVWLYLGDPTISNVWVAALFVMSTMENNER